jgi:uncharacterized protein (DUF1501 family)
MKRREFIKNIGMVTGAGTVSLSIAGIPIKAFARPFLNIQSTNGKILVLVQFKGGNDGLNTVIPFEDAVYYNKRPVIGIPKTNVIQLTSLTGIHPSLQPLKQLYDNGKIAVIQNVGYPAPNRSHFRSTDIWLSASDSNQFIYDGWVGRYLLKTYPDFPNVPPAHPMAIQIGSVQSGIFDSSQGGLAVSFDNPDAFYTLVNGITADTDPPPATIAGDELKFLKEVAALSIQYASVIKEKADVRPNMATYPNTSFANQLKIVADLIGGGLTTPVYLTTLDGFDTHSGQLTQHEKLLGYFADAVAAFQKDIELLGVDDKVVLLTFSEFGRRVNENASAGTDHGTAAPMFLIGKNVQGNVVGNNPSLTDLDSNGDIKFVLDFRQVYATMLKDHFGMTSAQVKDILLKDFQILPLLNTATDVKSDFNIPMNYSLNQNYPNPFNPETKIQYSLPQPSEVSLKVYDILGRNVATIVNSYQSAGSYNVNFDGSNLASGTYFYALETGGQKIVKKMMVVK